MKRGANNRVWYIAVGMIIGMKAIVSLFNDRGNLEAATTTRWMLCRAAESMDNDYYSIEAILAENQVGQYNTTVAII